MHVFSRNFKRRVTRFFNVFQFSIFQSSRVIISKRQWRRRNRVAFRFENRHMNIEYIRNDSREKLYSSRYEYIISSCRQSLRRKSGLKARMESPRRPRFWRYYDMGIRAARRSGRDSWMKRITVAEINNHIRLYENESVSGADITRSLRHDACVCRLVVVTNVRCYYYYYYYHHALLVTRKSENRA